jgi:hypothetical protein
MHMLTYLLTDKAIQPLGFCLAFYVSNFPEEKKRDDPTEESGGDYEPGYPSYPSLACCPGYPSLDYDPGYPTLACYPGYSSSYLGYNLRP